MSLEQTPVTVPLSYAQEGLWAAWKLNPESAAYNLPAVISLKGRVDVSALQRCVNELLRRHDSLRAAFPLDNHRPIQRFSTSAMLPLSVIDLRALPVRQRRRRVELICNKIALQPFDIERGPCIRVALITIGVATHALVLTLHHIICDSWSLGLLRNELGLLYSFFSKGSQSFLPAPPLQYADFVRRQRESTESTTNPHLAYWQKKLHGVPPVIALPTDNKRGQAGHGQAGVEHTLISNSLSEGLTKLAERAKVTPFILFLAALQTLLHRYSGQEAIVVGAPVSGRPTANLSQLIGCCVNILALRADFAEPQSFLQLLGNMRTTCIEAYQHADLPFEKLLEALRPPRQLDCRPICQVMFNMIPKREQKLQLVGLGIRAVGISGGDSKFDLIFNIIESKRRAISIEFNRDLFEPVSVAAMLSNYVTLLEDVVAHPEKPVSDLALLPQKEENSLLLKEWSLPASHAPRSCLHEIFDQQAAKRPDATALVFENGNWTYSELNDRANRLAHRLRSIEAPIESRIAVWMERSPYAVAAILAVLKAGYAYVPIDASCPAERADYIMRDAGVRAAIVQEQFLSRMPTPAPLTICIDRETEEAPAKAGLNFSPVDPDNIAYVIYTSGSTGRPKGVMVTHANVLRLFQATQEWFKFGSNDVWTLFHSIAFDFSVWEMFGALLHGGKLLIVPYWLTLSAARFIEVLHREGVTVLNQTPSSFRHLLLALQGLDQSQKLALRYIIFGGEALDFSSLAPWFACPQSSTTKLINMYGITETTVHVTGHVIEIQDLNHRANNMLGSPMTDLRLYVTDESLRLVPQNVIGELTVAGAGLARGYHNRPELTAERFVPNPWSRKGGERIYRSGDSGRHLTNGNIEYLGRLDQQVKIRGFRIELGEIERTIAEHANINECVVIARLLSSGTTELVAYVTCKQEFSERELRAFLSAKLPDYMIPSHFILLTEMPVTGNFKIDRRGLPSPESVHEPVITDSDTEITDEMELKITRLWKQILGERNLNPLDSFFLVGGDSLKAIELLALINQSTSAGLEIRDLFRFQSIRDLSRVVRQRLQATVVSERLEQGHNRIRDFKNQILQNPEARRKLTPDWEDVYPLSPAENGIAYSALLRPDEPVYHDQFVYTLENIEPLDLVQCIEWLARKHDILRAGIDLLNFAEGVKIIRRDVRLPITVCDLSDIPPEAQVGAMRRYITQDVERRFLTDGRMLMWRAGIFVRSSQRLTVMWTVHHAILDGWSNISFWVELNNLRQARRELGSGLPADKLACSYKDYVALRWGAGRDAEDERFWRSYLAGYRRTPPPFMSRNRSSSKQTMACYQRILPKVLLQTLKERAREHQVTLNAVLLAGYIYLLGLTSAEPDILIGVVTSDRPEIPDGDKLLGCFLNTIPFRLRRSSGEGKLSLVEKAQQSLFEIQQHQMPLAEIVAAVGERSGTHNPLFDCLFNFTDFHVLEKAITSVPIRSAVDKVSTRDEGLPPTNEATNTLFDFEVSTTLDQLTARVKYSPANFARQDIARVIDLYEMILDSMGKSMADPFEENALKAILVPAVPTEFPVERTSLGAASRATLQAMFEEQAKKQPRAVAVIADNERITYEALDKWANRLAQLLGKRGVRPGDGVALCAPRTADAVAGMLAIVKAGAFYVPIEASMPAARISAMCKQSNIRAALIGAAVDREMWLSQTDVVMATRGCDVDACDPVRPTLNIASDSLAYTIYTSGSTGIPKGVMIEHSSIINLIGWVNREFNVGAGDRVLCVSSFSFDLSVYDVFGALSAGGSVVLASRESVQDAELLAQLLSRERITFWDSVPSTMAHLLDYLDKRDEPQMWDNVRVVFLSGDTVPPALVRRISVYFPCAGVIALGGATEAAVWSIYYPCWELPPEASIVPYGRPIANTRIYVLDKDLQPMPPGVLGEIFISGLGLARGYADNPTTTRSAFILKTWETGRTERLYRTGDLGKLRSDGDVEIAGRVDECVKIRGFRVEPGEIESALQLYPGITQAAVVDREEGADGKRLCAFIRAAETISSRELRRHLLELLPDYMVPSAFVKLESFPLTGNGKVDRNFLRQCNLDPEPKRESTEPRNEIEEVVAGAFCSVLRLANVSIFEDFFELGGHSITAMQLVTRLRSGFNVELSLRQFFSYPTIAETAELIRQGRLQRSDLPLVAFGREQRLPLSVVQEGIWLAQEWYPSATAHNLGGIIRLRGQINLASLRAALQEVVRRHEILRTTYTAVDGIPEQRIHPTAELDIPEVELHLLPEAAREAELHRIALQQKLEPYDLFRGPVIRCMLCKLGEDEWALAVSMHHIATDAWSLGIFAREAMALYDAFSHGMPSPLLELPIQYADYAAWQRQWLESKAAEEQLSYWEGQLAGVKRLDLDIDNLGSTEENIGAGIPLPFQIESRYAIELRNLARRQDVTLFMALLAVLDVLLYRISGSEDVLVVTNAAQRIHPETENLIGCFINSLPLRTDLSGNPSFLELLARVRHITLEAYDRQEIPFEHVLRTALPADYRGQMSAPQVVFVFQNGWDDTESRDNNLNVTYSGISTNNQGYDITFLLQDNGDSLTGSIQYRPDLFRAETIERIIAEHKHLLSALVENPAQRIGDLPLLPVSERDLLEYQLNDNAPKTRG